VKICGITAVDHAVAIEKLGAEYIGLVFAESRRKIALEVAIQICQKLNTSQSVGVFLNQNAQEINSIYKTCQLDYVQIHGDTDFELLDIPTDRIIKAIAYNDKHPTHYDFLLIDGTLPGSGETYTLKDVHLIENQVYILAGGITSKNVKERINEFNFKIVDISSGVETDGIKDIRKVETFIQTVRSI
jgi:phosphoribosylanthranilate isomerase